MSAKVGGTEQKFYIYLQYIYIFTRAYTCNNNYHKHNF